MSDGATILASLELMAERHGDPTTLIYAELFASNPELEALFWLDRDGGVRAAMVQQGLECVLDHAGGGAQAAAIIGAARHHHDGYGVPPEKFDHFFAAMRDAFRRALGADWTVDMERAWGAMLTGFEEIR